MTSLTIEQAVLDGGDAIGRSPDFRDDWLDAAKRIAHGFGVLPPGHDAILAIPLVKRVKAVVQVRGRRFRVLAVPERLYRALHDPFRIAAQWPADFSARGDLAPLEWTDDPPALRSVEAVRAILQTEDGPTFLGAAQALLDGGRVAFLRSSPDADELQRLWLLLPASNRAELSMATFAVSNALKFDVLVTPSVSGPDFRGYLTDAQAGDYPEGRYELALQTAAESGDAAKLQELLARRSGSQSLRLACTLLFVALALGVAVRLIPWEKLR